MQSRVAFAALDACELRKRPLLLAALRDAKNIGHVKTELAKIKIRSLHAIDIGPAELGELIEGLSPWLANLSVDAFLMQLSHKIGAFVQAKTWRCSAPPMAAANPKCATS